MSRHGRTGDWLFAAEQTAAFDRRNLTLAGHFKSYAPAQLTFFTTPIQHSEKPEDHALTPRILDAMGEGDSGLPVQSMKDHKAVVDRFGRYPHRNHLLGRTSTPEEQAWLDDYDNLPGWARSQMPKK